MTRSWYEQVRQSSQRASLILGALDMAPLMDVALLLVIFALIMAGFVFQPAVYVELPTVARPDAARGRTLTLAITADEQVFVFDSTFPTREAARPILLRDALAARLSDFYHRDPDGLVLIKADYRVRHGVLLHIMEMIRDAGLRRIAFAAREEAATLPQVPPLPSTPSAP